ncbi:MAG: 2-phosphosulfolactate phosphatase, partial [Spirochaetes bacterium]|nr:2-phosphosulfolactate phosphatase [Spirochaetota bacterium]
TTAVANGFTIIPSDRSEDARHLADRLGCAVSGPTGKARYSLSPLDYLDPKAPEDVVLVSPNGAALARIAGGEACAFIACLLNARTAGRLLREVSEGTGKGIVLIAAGEAAEGQEQDIVQRRFAIEDYLGCGAILAELRMEETPEAVVCRRTFEACRHDCAELIRGSLSGRYLAKNGCDFDLSHCVQWSIYDVLPIVRHGRITAYEGDLG